MKRLVKMLSVFGVFALCLFVFGMTTDAADVEDTWNGKTVAQWAKQLNVSTESIIVPGGKGNAISNTAEEVNAVTLLPGGTYNFTKPIYPKSGLKIIANGATIKTDHITNIILDRDHKKKGYSNLSNVSIEGGKWILHDSGTSKLSSGPSALKFVHAQNITIKNVTMTSNYVAHFVEFIGVKNATVDGSSFKMESKHRLPDNKNEAIQLDFASGGSNAVGVYPDNTTCKNITITNNNIYFYRGICNNTRSNGKAKSVNYANIVIKNNTISAKKGEAIFVERTTGVTVKNNKVGGSTKTKLIYVKNCKKTSGAKTLTKLSVNAVKKGKTKITGKKDSTATIYVKVNGKTYKSNKKSSSYTVKVPKLKKGTKVTIYESKSGNKCVITKKVS